MRKAFWKWLRNVLDSTGTWIDVVARWFEDAALWIDVNKCAKDRIPLDRIGTLDPTQVAYIQVDRIATDFPKWNEPPSWSCTCWNRGWSGKQPVRMIDPECPIHGAKP